MPAHNKQPDCYKRPLAARCEIRLFQTMTSALRTIRQLAIVCAGVASANAQLITWNTFGNAGTETSETSASNSVYLTSSDLILGSGLPGASNANRFGSNNWFDTGNTGAGSTLAEAIAGNNYIQFTVTPLSGSAFTPTSFVFNWERSGTGPGSVTLRSSADSYSSDLGSLTGLSASLTTGNSITITGLTNLTTATTFRLYGYGATATSGTGGFDTSSNAVNVQLNGTAIPEPSTYAAIFGAVVLGGAVWHRRRQRQKTIAVTPAT